MNLEFRIPESGLSLADRWECDVVRFEKKIEWTEDERTPILHCHFFRSKTELDAFKVESTKTDVATMHRAVIVADGTDNDSLPDMIQKLIQAQSSTTTIGESVNFNQASILK